MLHYIQNDIKNSVDLFNTEEIVSSKYVLFIFGWMCEWKAQVEGGVGDCISILQKRTRGLKKIRLKTGLSGDFWGVQFPVFKAVVSFLLKHWQQMFPERNKARVGFVLELKGNNISTSKIKLPTENPFLVKWIWPSDFF